MKTTIITGIRAAGLAVFAAGLLAAVAAQGAWAAEPGFGRLFFDGQVVGTVVPPAHVQPGTGRDPFFVVTNGAGGQLGIAGVGPGGPGYHGGDWAVSTVTFAAGHTPYLLESGAAVAEASQKGDVTITRQPAKDFRCPITRG